MTSITVRPFQRGDRDQLTALVNAHARAVVPGASISVNAVMNQLEREPGEFIVDPWVEERTTLVAELRSRVVGAAHVLRYSAGDQVGEDYRGAGEIRWFLFWPESPNGPYWPGPAPSGDKLLSACCQQLDEWRVSRQYADGTLPAPGVYGVPEQWLHVRAAYERGGFRHTGSVEIVYMASIADLDQTSGPPFPGVSLQRSVGVNGTRLSAVLAGNVIGYVEVDMLDLPQRQSSLVAWADIGNLHISEEHRRRGLATWLVGRAAGWLRLSGADHVLDYASPEQTECTAFIESAGFHELTRTARGWTRG
jgi:GNAT superfamily N-acetyltransferase